MFSALVVSEATDGFEASVRDVDEADLPDGDVTVDVEYSSINYKDALAIVNGKPVLRQFPMVPGIDLAGTVSASSSDEWSVGDTVVLDGWGVGEERWGGLAQKARVDGSWLVPVPDGWSTRDAMAVGTAGFTAALAVSALDDHGLTAPGPVLVTGASGGVGSFAIMLLAAGGIDAIAASRTPGAASYLTSLGASEIIDSTELGTDVRALGKQRWWGAIDNVGGSVLAGVISSTTAGGAVAACGNAGGMDLPTTVAPFILRGVSLLGIDSVRVPRAARLAAWAMLAERVPRERLAEVTAEVGLAEAIPTAKRLLANDLTGRVVVDVRR
ncbi:MAG: MDR family oxidoreductase [Acidimicrobiia bacterium]